MQLSAYLSFDGECQAAFEFYQALLGARLQSLVTYKEVDEAVPENWQHKVVHASLLLGEGVGDGLLMGSDARPGDYQSPSGFSLELDVPTAESAARIFSGLSEGGSIKLPLQPTSWASHFGMLVDRFAIPWSINSKLTE